MNPKKYFFLPVVIIFMLSLSCSYIKYRSENIKLDSINAMLSKTEKKLDEVKVDSILNRYHKYEYNVERLMGFETDTINQDVYTLIMRYKFAKKVFKNFPSRKASLMNEVNVSKKQLENLKTDLNNGLLPDEEFSKYYQEELKATTALRDEVFTEIDGLKSVVSKFDSANIEVEKKIEELNTIHKAN